MRKSMDAARIGLKCAACQCYDRDQRTYGCLAMYMIHMRRAPLHRGTYQGSDAAREICGLRLSALFISFFLFPFFLAVRWRNTYVCAIMI